MAQPQIPETIRSLQEAYGEIDFATLGGNNTGASESLQKFGNIVGVALGALGVDEVCRLISGTRKQSRVLDWVLSSDSDYRSRAGKRMPRLLTPRANSPVERLDQTGAIAVGGEWEIGIVRDLSQDPEGNIQSASERNVSNVLRALGVAVAFENFPRGEGDEETRSVLGKVVGLEPSLTGVAIQSQGRRLLFDDVHVAASGLHFAPDFVRWSREVQTGPPNPNLIIAGQIRENL